MMVLTRGHNNTQNEINEVATNTFAITFVLVGLIMQLSSVSSEVAEI